MRQKNHRKGLMFGFTVMAAFLALMSVAYGCTVFKGTLGIIGDGDAFTNHSHKQGDPRFGMTYCSTGHNHEGASAGKQGYNDSAADIKIKVEPSSSCGGSKLNADNYDLMLLGNGSDPFFSDGNWRIDCMNSGTWTHRLANAVPVDSTGTSGTVGVNLSGSSLVAGPGAVCIADDGDNEGNQVPIDWL